jgi:hypothetical protein
MEMQCEAISDACWVSVKERLVFDQVSQARFFRKLCDARCKNEVREWDQKWLAGKVQVEPVVRALLARRLMTDVLDTPLTRALL